MSESISMRPVELPVDEFLAANDPDGSLAAIDAVITSALPDGTRVLWQGVFWGGTDQSIIGYGSTSQPRPRGKSVDWFLVGLARQKNYISLYVNAVDDGVSLVGRYAERLGKVKSGSANLTFASVDAIDLDVLGELVRHASRVMAYT